MHREVFLSYSTDDTLTATAVRDHLERRGIGCWMAPRDITPGMDYGEQIIDAIEDATILLLVLSESSNQSTFVRHEVERAVSKGKIIIPLRIQPVQPSRSLEFFISNYQWIEDWELPIEKSGDVLVRAIQNHLEGKAIPPIGPLSLPRQVTPSPLSNLLHNLPHQLTPFIGREAELAALDRLLAEKDVRLITILGPGGMGKTRLALAAAERHLADPRYAQGIYFVSLAALSDVQHIVPAVAEAISFGFQSEGESRSARQQLLDYLRAKRMLLIFDNFEHLLDGVELLVQILQTAPEVEILVTSRERLRCPGEHLLSLQGFEVGSPQELVDAAGVAAVQLFLQSARQVVPGITFSQEELTHVVRICRLVSGMPLGIELAAAWTEVLSPSDIAVEIERSLDFLRVEGRGGQEHHRSLRAIFDSTWQRLDQREQEVIARLSVFRGGFTRQAAVETADASLPLLIALAGKSLVQHERDRDRYALHELLRQFAAERLAVNAELEKVTSEAHAHFYCTLMGQLESELKGYGQQAAINQIGADSENVRVAWYWAVTHLHVELLRNALPTLAAFYEWHNRYSEGEQVLADAVHMLQARREPSNAERCLLAHMLAWQSVFQRSLWQLEKAHTLLQQSLLLLESSTVDDVASVRAFALLQMGHILRERGEYDNAIDAYIESQELNGARGDEWGQANALAGLGAVANLMGNYEQAQRLLKESLLLYKGDAHGRADTLALLGDVARDQARLEDAKELVTESVALYSRLGDRSKIAAGQVALGWLCIYTGELEEARSLIEKSTAGYEELGQLAPIGVLAVANLELGRYKEARALLQPRVTQSRESGDRVDLAFVLSVLGCVNIVETRYIEAEEMLAESVTLHQEIGEQDRIAYTTAFRGYAARGLGQRAAARRFFLEALQIAVITQGIIPLLFSLPGIALLLVDEGQLDAAMELYSQVAELPNYANSRLHWDLSGREISAAIANHPAEWVAAAQLRAKAGDLWVTASACLADLRKRAWHES